MSRQQLNHAAALAATVAALEVGAEHGALVALCEALAAALDTTTAAACGECGAEFESVAPAALFREYRAALGALAVVAEAGDDGQAAFLAAVRTPVGDPKKKRTPKSGTGGRGSGGKSRSAADAVAKPSRRRRPRAAG